METLYICGEADISRDENTILIKTHGAKKRVPIEAIRHIVVMSDGTLTTKFLALSGRAGVRVSVFDYYGWFAGAFEPVANTGSGEVKIRQARLILDPTRRMAVAREIIRGTLFNIMEGLRYYAYRGAEDLKLAIQEIRGYEASLARATDPETLMGFEGIARRVYYEAWGKVDARLAFAPRIKRPPNNRHEISKTHLDVTLSVLHAPSSARSSLALDLAEPFKPVVVDRQIFAIVRKNILADGWFDEKGGVCMLTETGRRSVVERFATTIDSASSSGSIQNAMRWEALKLQRHVMDIDEYTAYRRST
jgi:CRISP-associated protein Cas1